jgi:hypothetical protein
MVIVAVTRKSSKDFQCTISVSMHTSDEVRLEVTAKSFVPSPIPTSPHPQQFSGTRAEYEV